MDQRILSKVRLKPRWLRKTKPIRMIKREEVLIFWKLPESSATLVMPPLKQLKNKRISAEYVETNLFSKYVSMFYASINENLIDPLTFIWLWCSIPPTPECEDSSLLQTPPICLVFVMVCVQWSWCPGVTCYPDPEREWPGTSWTTACTASQHRDQDDQGGNMSASQTQIISITSIQTLF